MWAEPLLRNFLGCVILKGGSRQIIKNIMQLKIVKTVYENAYYHCYLITKSITFRNPITFPTQALFLFTIPLFLNFLSIFAYCPEYISFRVPIFFVLMMGAFFFNFHYFLKNNYYEKIISRCSSLTIKSKVLYLLVELLYVSATIWVFIVSIGNIK